jgi:Na+-transporting NADH:ubiquinone oxidoreductase subunit NqrC
MRKNILAIVFIISVLANIIIAGVCYSQYREIQNQQKQIKSQQLNKGALSFLNLFIEKVLDSDTEVSFNDRLKLENAIRDLKDKELLAQWEKFTNSTTQNQVQQEAKNLLDLLAKKISY